MADKPLKKGFTTGAAASAAVKAALITLLSSQRVKNIEIDFLTHGTRMVPVERITRFSDTFCEAVIIKDAGDDPDITHRAKIGARVSLDPALSKGPGIEIRGGKGVGRVTKPGLELAVGEPAINPGPRRMITEAVGSVFRQLSLDLTQRVIVEVFVPKGEELAKKTLNGRLGIMGGISILGTTGIVRPMSHDAYIATIKSSISVAAAKGISTLVYTTGRRSERFAMGLFPGFEEEAFIQTGDFFKAAIDRALEQKNAGQQAIRQIVYTVFFGKAVKMAMGFEHTHAAKSELTMKRLTSWVREMKSDDDLVRNIEQANTARHAFTFLYPDHPEIMARVGRKILETTHDFSNGKIDFRVIILDFNGKIAFDSNSLNGIQR